jgi:hypothetical protein
MAAFRRMAHVANNRRSDEETDEETMMVDEKIDQVRNRAYQIWERKGRPQGRDLEHWLEAERELEAEDERNHGAKKEEAGLEAARAYNRDVQEFGRHENVEAKAQEAKHAIESAEASELERAEAVGKSRSRSKT